MVVIKLINMKYVGKAYQVTLYTLPYSACCVQYGTGGEAQ